LIIWFIFSAFGGDSQLKIMIQWLAASQAGCKGIIIYTFGDKKLAEDLKRISTTIWMLGKSVGEIYQILINKPNDKDLFTVLEDMIAKEISSSPNG